MQRFDPEAAAVIASETLLEQALGSRSDTHQAYLCCALTRRGPPVSALSIHECFRWSGNAMGQ